MTLSRLVIPLGAALALAACSTPPRDKGIEEVRESASAAVEEELVWARDAETKALVSERVAALLVGDLSEREAIAVALLSNPGLQGTIHRLGLAQADWIEAGLLNNPIFNTSIRFPEGGSGTNIELSILQNIVTLLMRPARRQIAAERFQQAVLEVTQAVIDLQADVRGAYFRAQAAAEAVRVVEQQMASAAEARSTADRLLAGGAITELQALAARLRHEETRAAAARRYGDAANARADLNRLMGIWGQRGHWEMPSALPSVPNPPLDPGGLEVRAVSQRMDLLAAQARCRSLAAALELERDWRWLPSFQVGLGPEREADGEWLIGPALQFPIPIFDRNQDTIRRFEARLAAAEQELMDLAIGIRTGVQSGAADLITAARLARHQRDVVLPMNRRAAELARQQHADGVLDTLGLLGVERELLAAQQDRIQRRLDYWLARVELERRLGGPIPRHRID